MNRCRNHHYTNRAYLKQHEMECKLWTSSTSRWPRATRVAGAGRGTTRDIADDMDPNTEHSQMRSCMLLPLSSLFVLQCSSSRLVSVWLRLWSEAAAASALSWNRGWCHQHPAQSCCKETPRNETLGSDLRQEKIIITMDKAGIPSWYFRSTFCLVSWWAAGLPGPSSTSHEDQLSL